MLTFIRGNSDASRTAERYVHSLFANSERKPPEGTGLKNLILEEILMSKVVYRGVSYDTENRPNQTVQPSAHVEVYRGVKFYVDAQGNKNVMIVGDK